jgi:predicted extracellular nuclease
MKKIFTFFTIAFLLGTFTSFGQVIISQMYEGSGFNKFIEITNMGSSAVNLASPQLYVKLYSNKTEIGANAPQYTKTLTGSLNAGQSLLLHYSTAVNPAYALAYAPGDTGTVCNFNGKGSSANPTASTDIISLYDGSTLVDVFSWGTFQYENKSYVRAAAITTPNAVFNAADWVFVDTLNAYNALPNTPERLGYHIGGSTTPAMGISSPSNGATIYSPDVNITFSVYNFTIPTDGHVHYTVDGGAVNEQMTTSPIALTALAAGSHTVALTLVDASHNPLSPNVTASVTFTVNLSGPSIKTIYQIQYTTLPTGDSPLKDSIVTTSGIVTASFASGYFIQDGTTPWNGLYVYDNTHTPALGDSITLGGTVSEYYNYTELKTIVSYTTNATGKPVPTPIGLTTNTVKSEQYEGMLVKLTNAKCTYVHSTGWWKVFQGADTCEIGKLMFPFPTAVVGTYYNVTGCVNYSFSQFMVEPRNTADIEIYNSVSENAMNNLSMYPNPVASVLNISNMENVDQIRVVNLLGETVSNHSVSGSTASINVNSLPNGIYFVSLLNDNSVLVTRKFIKQ